MDPVPGSPMLIMVNEHLQVAELEMIAVTSIVLRA